MVKALLLGFLDKTKQEREAYNALRIDIDLVTVQMINKRGLKSFRNLKCSDQSISIEQLQIVADVVYCFYFKRILDNLIAL
jgi:hypothetical protein